MTLHPGKKVMLHGLQSSVELNGQEGVLCEYAPDAQRWVVELPCGRKFNVREANMQTQTRETMAQNIFHAFGYPMLDAPALADIVEERTGPHGRFLVAKVPIAAGTFAQENKLRVSMTADEMQQLVSRYVEFAGQAVTNILGKPVLLEVMSQNFNVSASYLGTCVQEKWLQHDLVRDLMRYDFYSPETLQQTIERMNIEDVLWLEFWCRELPELSPDQVWCLQSFLMSHACLEDRTITLGIFCKALCPPERWNWYNARRRGKNPAPISRSGNGNITEIPSWSVQTHVGPGQIRADSCIIVHKNVRAGEPLLYDYGEDYFPHKDKQLGQACPPELRPVLFHIFRRFDPRVTEALRAHCGV